MRAAYSDLRSMFTHHLNLRSTDCMEAQISSYEQKIVQSESYCNHSFFSALLFSMYICAFQHRMWDKIHDSDLSWFMERRKRTWSAGAGFGSSSAAKRCTISSLRLWETCTDVWKISMCARTETHTQHTQPGNFFFTNHRVLGRLLRFLAHSVLFFFFSCRKKCRQNKRKCGFFKSHFWHIICEKIVPSFPFLLHLAFFWAMAPW